MWNLCLVFITALLSSAPGEDTVAEDIGVHQLQRLVDLLTEKECEELLDVLSHPEENVFGHFERLSPERNHLDLKPRTKRDTSSSEDRAAECRTALTDWLLRYGEQVYYDKLSRALQHIGRTDIAIEVGTNINEERISNLRRYVDGYHEYASSLNVPPIPSDAKRRGDAGQRKKRRRKVKEPSWRDLDLVVEVGPVAPYLKGPLDVVLPVLYGVLLGFGGCLFAGVAILLIAIRFANKASAATAAKLKV